MGHRFMYELGLALGFIACVVIVLKWAGTELIHSIFPPKDDKETKAVTEVQEPEKREDPPASTAADNSTTTNSNQPLVIEVNPELYRDGIAQSTGEPEVSYEDETIGETSRELSDYEITMARLGEIMDNMGDEAVNAQIEQAAAAAGFDMLRITMNYAEENAQYLNMIGVSSQDVMNISSAIFTNSTAGDTILNPENPDRSAMIVSSYNETEIFRIIFTINTDDEIDVDAVLNESGYVDVLTSEIEALAHERSQQ